ncbi:MAG TPA: condensation domain-containing protein, partial [Thermosynechococcaceae cyanobacterium]
MTNLTADIANFSSDKQALFQLLLKKKGIHALGTQTIHRRSDRDSVQLSFAQQRLWFLAQLEPDSPFYNIPSAFRLHGQLNQRAIEQSFNEILRRHEVLRTAFKTVDGQPVAVISPETSLIMPVIDLSELLRLQQDAKVQELILAEAQQPFDLNTNPLLRVKLLRLSEAEHVVLVTMHHIASDGWSIQVLVREVSALYQAFCSGQPSPLPELPIQYADFAAWQRQWLQGRVLDTQLAYWRQQLEGAPAVLNLPSDRTRPAVQTFQGATYSFKLPQALSVALKTLSQQEGSTLFMTLLAAFRILLSRYAGNEDIVVGSPIANRNQAETEGLIGFFVNTLVLRTDLSGNPSFRELLRRVREFTLGAYDHQDLPFERLVEELASQRDLSYTPLFQVMFVLQNAPMSAIELSGLTLNSLKHHSNTTKFDVTLYVEETGEELIGTLEYSTDLFDAITIRRMAGHLQTLLEGIIAHPDRPIQDLPLLTKGERQQLLQAWNDTQAEYPQDRCLHQLFEEQVEQTPDAIAAVFEDQQLTYRELNARANQLAHHLQKLGVKPEVLVGICVERSLEMLISLLGILKAGGAYIPLDPAYPKKRLAFMLEDAQVSLVISHGSFVNNQGFLTNDKRQRTIICLDADWEAIAQQSEENLDRAATPNNLAYVIYTSGSTGKPKGVQISHRALVNFLGSMRLAPGLSEQDILLAVTTLSFDIAGLELYLSLIVGARVVIASREVAADGIQLSELLTHSGATVMQATPATWRLLLAAGWQGNKLLKILCGGEALSRELAYQLLTRCHS